MARRPVRHAATCLAGSAVLALAVPAARAADGAADGVPGNPPAATEFDPAFLHGTGGRAVDVSRFERGNAVLPGDYLVDLVVNGTYVDRLHVAFRAQPDGDARPCLTPSLLEIAGLVPAALPREARGKLAAAPAGSCVDLASLSDEIRASFDQSRLALALSVPQQFLSRAPRGYVGPDAWNKGIDSATLRYDLNFFHTDTSAAVANSLYLRMDAGLNLGTWHLRQSFTITADNDRTRYDGIATYLVHDLPALESRLVIGDAFTDGAVFDSFAMRGVMLGTDDRMRPDSRAGYAPTVRGIARTNARLRIVQNGVVLLETTVPPGPFEIDDLYPTGYGGDLEVTVLEADGSRQSFTVPYAALPQMLRPGVMRYGLAGGEYRDNGIATGEDFFQLTLQYGLSNALTGYGGVQFAGNYAAGLVGASLNTPLGALALDATIARTDPPGQPRTQGTSIRASLAKTLTPTQTTLSFAGYRYSSSGFYSLQDALRARLGRFSLARQRERMQVNVSQKLPGTGGNLYFTGSTTRYWGQSGQVLALQAGYNNSARLLDRSVNYGWSYVHQKDEVSGRDDDRALVTIAFGLGSGPNAPQVSANVSHASGTGQGGDAAGQISVSGTLGPGARLSYGLIATAMPDFTALGVNLGYTGKRTTLSGSASVGSGFRQASFGMSGGVVVHAGGITFANRLEDTVALVHAPGAKGAAVKAALGIEVDGKGFAVVPYIRPYRINEIALDPEGLPLDVTLSATSRRIAPRADTVALVRFDTSAGQALVFRVTLPDGSDAPFGAAVLDSAGHDVGVVGQGGQVFLRSEALSGRLTVRWNEGADGSCRFAYAFDAAAPAGPIIRNADQVCRPLSPENPA
ncbi:fimbrial biogenesis outer membrane usher protein [Novosphingobium flavum]|uniref:Fimbrial biogenesis outer membrane usher protein n=1 Tax=Novosphingobium flavum TaxID=1778672 RepID=A0A7X1KMZ0_9SPHN|nr:fimbria/pilus outer membrane usher protein [Novosphingobium flavum]MBC2666810.1 fimbrial biogenesis outer membrane usher protein [Novosphingobium flavum]